MSSPFLDEPTIPLLQGVESNIKERLTVSVYVIKMIVFAIVTFH